MTKRLSFLGKVIYLFTSLFPLYLFWAYFYIMKIDFYKLIKLHEFDFFNIFMGGLFLICLITSPIIFFNLIKNKKSADCEILVKSSKKDSKYAIYFLGAISPFLTFLLDFFLKNSELHIPSMIVATSVFILGGIILIFKDEYGVLYNLFFLKYHFILVQDKIIVSNQEAHSGYVKVTQLNNRVFKTWN